MRVHHHSNTPSDHYPGRPFLDTRLSEALGSDLKWTFRRTMASRDVILKSWARGKGFNCVEFVEKMMYGPYYKNPSK